MAAECERGDRSPLNQRALIAALCVALGGCTAVLDRGQFLDRGADGGPDGGTTDPNDRCEGCADDGIACTVEVCDAAGNCLHAENDSLCDDGLACTSDNCDVDQGGCVYVTNDAACDDGVDCTVDGCRTGEGCVHAMNDAACADTEACTQDVCTPTGCANQPIESSCDDGVFCNGADSCSAGTCSVHTNDPCAPPTQCVESQGACVGCRTAADCPGRMEGAWSACSFASMCATSGTQTRSVTTYECGSSGECVASTNTETQACTRTTDGATCGSPATQTGTCAYSSVCDESGSRTVTTTTYTCSNGGCNPTSSMRSEACSRSTEGIACGRGGTCTGGTCVIETDPCGCAPNLFCCDGFCSRFACREL